ncbi:hypothetical protein C5613_40590 [Rhodococcus opacus]|uniref:Uncharacterized protein n=1 Tax=Rhodococcus opacus TaxID=37919 RepID=A0A2S8IIB2_RHOOP|nr:hypothetical protein C5613_40590 [Rhodococcus opacus]
MVTAPPIRKLRDRIRERTVHEEVEQLLSGGLSRPRRRLRREQPTIRHRAGQRKIVHTAAAASATTTTTITTVTRSS